MKHTHTKHKTKSVLVVFAAGVATFFATDAVFASDVYPAPYQVTTGKTDQGSITVRNKRAFKPIAPVSLNLNYADGSNLQKVAMVPAPAVNRPQAAADPVPSVTASQFNPYNNETRVAPPLFPDPSTVTVPKLSTQDYPEFAHSDTIAPPPIPDLEPETVEIEPEPKQAPVVKKSAPTKSSSRNSWFRSSSSRGRSSSSSDCRT